jgi:Ser/Thr protein kinase RdoA (MazF antagonist)
MPELNEHLRARLERLLGDRVTRAEHAFRGYTPAGRWRVELHSGNTAFAKIATTRQTAEALRSEWNTYDKLRAPFMPKLLAWEEDAVAPMMVLEDLKGAHWPPPWTGELVNDVRATLDAMHSTRAQLKNFAELHGSLGDGWQQVAANPAPFLGLGLATSDWLETALPLFIQASAKVRIEGNDVLHLDVRSDNLCRASRGVVFIDWNFACLGNGVIDTAFWLPSLEAEGGPRPEDTLPNRPDIAAYVSGFFAARAGLPPIPDAPRVRTVQLQQLEPALRWAAREIALPPPTSPA